MQTAESGDALQHRSLSSSIIGSSSAIITARRRGRGVTADCEMVGAIDFNRLGGSVNRHPPY
jgi:hypothetical protein